MNKEKLASQLFPLYNKKRTRESESPERLVLFRVFYQRKKEEMKMSYVDEIIAQVIEKNPAQPEFHQAVKEVLESLRGAGQAAGEA